MKPIEFAEQNIVFAKDQPEYEPLPAHVSNQGVTTCWQLSEEDKKRILDNRPIWVRNLTFGGALQPIMITTDPEEVYLGEHDPRPYSHELVGVHRLETFDPELFNYNPIYHAIIHALDRGANVYELVKELCTINHYKQKNNEQTGEAHS